MIEPQGKPDADRYSPIGFAVLPDGSIAGTVQRSAAPRALNGASAGPLGAWVTTAGGLGATFTPTIGGNVFVGVSATGFTDAVISPAEWEVRVLPLGLGNGLIFTDSGGPFIRKAFNVGLQHQTLPTLWAKMAWLPGTNLIAQDNDRYRIDIRAFSANTHLDAADQLAFQVIETFPGTEFSIGA